MQVELLDGFESNAEDDFTVYTDDNLLGCEPQTTPPVGADYYYMPDVVSANDYYPFGMLLPGRTFEAGSYAYGFNGKRKDNEMYGEGNAYDFGARILDPRLGGRWLSVDPLQQKYPGESPYLYTGGNPIIFADPDGRDRIIKTTVIGKDGKSSTITRVDKDFFLYREVDRPGFGNNSYYKANLEINLTVDLSKGTTTYQEQEGIKRHEISQGTYQLHRAGVFFSKIAGGTDSDKRGSQPGGLTLTSEFSTNGDGPKTDATKGSSGSVNIDLIMVAASTFSLPVEPLGTSIQDLPEWTSMVKDAVDAYKSIQENQKSESIIGSTNSTLDKTPGKQNSKPPEVVEIVNKQRQFSTQNDGSVRTTSADPSKPDTLRKYRYYNKSKTKSQSDGTKTQEKKAF